MKPNFMFSVLKIF